RSNQIIAAASLLKCAGRRDAKAVAAMVFDSNFFRVRLIALAKPLLLANGLPRSELRMYSLKRGVWSNMARKAGAIEIHTTSPVLRCLTRIVSSLICDQCIVMTSHSRCLV